MLKRPSLPMENQEEFCSALRWTESLPKISFDLSYKHASSLHCFIMPLGILWELKWLVHCILHCVTYYLLIVWILLQICFSSDWKKPTFIEFYWPKSFRMYMEKNVLLWFYCKVLMTFILNSSVLLRFIWIKTSHSVSELVFTRSKCSIHLQWNCQVLGL